MAIPLRGDFDAAALRAAAQQTKDAGQARRLLALAEIDDASSRTDAARIGGVTLQIVCALRLAQEGAALQQPCSRGADQPQGARRVRQPKPVFGSNPAVASGWSCTFRGSPRCRAARLSGT